MSNFHVVEVNKTANWTTCFVLGNLSSLTEDPMEIAREKSNFRRNHLTKSTPAEGCGILWKTNTTMELVESRAVSDWVLRGPVDPRELGVIMVVDCL